MDDRFISRTRTGVIAALKLTVTLGTALGCIGYGIVAQAVTDTEKSDTRNQLVQELGSDHQNDVDLASGNLTLRNRDVVLPGNGGIAHVAHEILTQETGAKVNYIPYPGGGPAALDVLGGHTDATLITLAAVTEYVRAGKLRALAVTTPYRSDALPQVPTMAEAGVPGFSVESWQGYFAPAGTPAPIVAKINRDLQTVLQAPDVRAQLEHMGFKVAGGSPADLGQSLQSERPRYARAIQSAGLSLR